MLSLIFWGKEKGIVNLKNLAGGGIVCGLNADSQGYVTIR
ncbi:hypothetical protein TRKP33_p0178 (plasmid) [Klebsiella pneumoniae]|nr:hypothetical protein TRKP33_p0178 [Klebsiella pneumoniae]